MGHWDPKSSSVSHCSISSLCEGRCAAFTFFDSPVDPQWQLPHLIQIPPNFLTLSRLQTGSLYMTADFSNTSPLSSLLPSFIPFTVQIFYGHCCLHRHPKDRIACPCPPFTWLEAPLYYVHPLGHGQLSPGFFLLLWPLFEFVLPSL